MKILKVYAKCAVNGMQQTILDNINPDIAEELFIDTIKEEHEKHYLYYDELIDKKYDNISDDDEKYEKISKEFHKTLDKCIEYAKEYKENSFGDYKIVYLEDGEEIESPDCLSYTFCDELEE